MPELSPPTLSVRVSFLAAMAEFESEGRGGAGDDTMIGSEIRGYRPSWATHEGFEQYVRWLRAQALENSPRPEGYVPSTTLWWIDGSDYLGRIAIRHRLTPALREVGGHIGYDVRPSARRQGHASAMLRAALPVALQLNIDPALLTCDTDNSGSRKVIERNGGALEDQRGDKLRFWVPTS
jgi:predicted acetyltransferase